MCEFEKKVKDKFDEILQGGGGLQGNVVPRIGVAVSGGADSMALLLALSEFVTPLYVITVNHNIRPAVESGGDVDFVLSVCEKLKQRGRDVICEAVELERGAVAREAERRGGGIEEAARHLRYAAFEKFVAAHKLAALCTAHTMNDQLETVLMRFLQGSPAEAAGGIRARREMSCGGNAVVARPLLGLTRTEIEAYVQSRGFSWRTDKTNFETDYLRNKIRLKLVPFLDEQFSGWQKSVLSGAEKACDDAELIRSCVEKVPVVENSENDVAEIPLSDFLSSPAAVQRRVLLSACNKVGEKARIPNQFIKDVLCAVNGMSHQNHSDGFTKHFAGIDIVLKKNTLFIKKHSEINTDFVFSDIIEETGTFEFPFGDLVVFDYKEQNGKPFVSVRAGEPCCQSSLAENIPLPFCVRNARLGDEVLCADGSLKKVSDIFSDWHVVPEKRTFIPVIQLLDEKDQRIKAVLACFLGYKDWIVKL